MPSEAKTRRSTQHPVVEKKDLPTNIWGALVAIVREFTADGKHTHAAILLTLLLVTIFGIAYVAGAGAGDLWSSIKALL